MPDSSLPENKLFIHPVVPRKRSFDLTCDGLQQSNASLDFGNLSSLKKPSKRLKSSEVPDDLLIGSSREKRLNLTPDIHVPEMMNEEDAQLYRQCMLIKQGPSIKVLIPSEATTLDNSKNLTKESTNGSMILTTASPLDLPTLQLNDSSSLDLQKCPPVGSLPCLPDQGVE